MNNYTVYHLHSELSLLDSCTNFKLYVDKAVELGQKAICFTEHGNIYNWIEKKEYCDKNGIKFIHGVECYLTEKLIWEDDKKVRDNYHTILIAKNEDGIKELNKLVDISSQDDHTYYKRRISFDEFFATSDNIIRISACLQSPLNKIRNEDGKQLLLDKLIKKYDYLEVQPHDVQDQKDYNQWLYEISKQYNKPLIAGTDTHSINEYKAECRKILKLCKRIEYDNEDDFDLTYKSYDELCNMFKKQNALPEAIYLEAIENTNVMADSVEEFEIDRSLKYPILYGKDDEKVFKERINRMYKDKVKRGIIDGNNPKYKENILEEFRVFKKTNMIAFMLFMSELLEWCWNNNIPIGYARGSCSGSTIAYIIDITDLDAVVWNTVFSRFCNEDRAGNEIGDIDIDISPSQQELVQQYIIDRFGADNTAYVLTTGTIAEKGTIDDICRALDIMWCRENLKQPKFNYDYSDEFKSYEYSKEKIKSPYSLDRVKQIKSEYEVDPEATKERYPEVFKWFDGLCGTVVSVGKHPAGVIACPYTLPDNYGTLWVDGKRVLQINMEECHTLQLAKYDCLGLKNVEIIKDTCEFLNIPYPKSHEINWNDAKVWEHITDSPIGIFQFEGDYAFDLLKKYKPTTINHLSLVNASLRPSGESYRDDLIAHKPCKNPSPIIDKLLEANEGYLVFQEDTIKFLTDICGLSGSEADNVRRAIGRKQLDRLQAALPRILEGYCEKSPQPREIAEQEAKQFLQIIEDSSNYQFGYNHSTSYSMLAYTCAMLRYYYPVEFITAYLNNAKNDSDVTNGTELMKSINIEMFPAKFRHSSAKYVPDTKNKRIYKGIASIKNLNTEIGEQLYAMRDMQFDTFIDFLKVNPCNSLQTEILIKLDFFSEFGKSQKLTRIYNLFSDMYKKEGGQYVPKKMINKEKTTYPHEILRKYSKETEARFNVYDMDGFCAEMISIFPDKELPLVTRLEAQSEYLGYIDYKNPKAEGYAYVLDVDTKYSPKLTMHCFDTGTTAQIKMQKTLYADSGIGKGSLIKYTTKPKDKKRKTENGWEATGETEPWIDTVTLYT